MKIGQYTLQEARNIAAGAVRSYWTRNGDNPAELSSTDALAVLDDMARCTPDLVAALWYRSCSDAQLKAFEHEWHAWQKEKLARRTVVSY